MHLYEWRKGGISFAKWVRYHISNLRTPKVSKASSLAEVEHRVKDLGNQREQTYTTSRTEGGLTEGATFQSYHHQSRKPLSKEAQLADFLLIWLKKCVMPMHPHEVVLKTVAFPCSAVSDSTRWIALLLAIMANLQYGLSQLIAKFMKGAMNSHMELAYTYLMSWFLSHCPMSWSLLRHHVFLSCNSWKS